MGLVRWIIGFLLAVLITAFAVANRQTVDIYWSPASDSLHWPLYLIVLSAMALGFVLGAIIVWISSLPSFFSTRRQRRTIRNLEKELEAVNKSEPVKAPEPDHKFLPAFLKKTNA